jgi:hypothetical protein
MQLTETQLATIETYLLSWELQFRDFYDEMFDHFCTEIEQRMSAGTSFDNALAETSYLFEAYEFKEGITEYFGLKAYEMAWFGKYKTKNNELLLNQFKQQVLSPKLLLWMLIYFATFQTCIYFSQSKLWVLLLLPALVIFIFAQMKLKTWKGFNWKKMLSAFDYNNFGVHKTKDTLFAKPHTFLHNLNKVMLLFMLSMNIPHLFIASESIALHWYVTYSVSFLIASFVVNNVADELIMQEKALGNTILTTAD